MGDDEPMTDPNAKAVTVAGPSDAGDGAVDLSVPPSGIVPQLQCVRAPQFEGHLPSFFFSLDLGPPPARVSERPRSIALIRASRIAGTLSPLST